MSTGRFLLSLSLIALSLGATKPGTAQDKTTGGEQWNRPIPGEARELYQAGLAELRAGRLEVAVEKLGQAIELAPHFYRAHEARAQIRTFHLHETGEVLAELRSAMRKEPDSPVYPLVLSRFLVQDKHQLEQRVLDTAPEWIYTNIVLAEREVKRTKDRAAYLEILSRIPTQNPHDARAWERLALMLLELKRYDDAAEAYWKAAQVDDYARLALPPRLWEVELSRADRTDEAMEKLRREIERRRSRHPPSEENLAVVHWGYTLVGDWDRAREVLKEMDALNPAGFALPLRDRKPLTARFTGGRDYDGPIVLYLDGSEKEIHRRYQEVADGKPQEAIEAIQKLLSHPMRPGLRGELFRGLMEKYVELGEFEAAEESLQRMLTPFPAEFRLPLFFARALTKAQRPTEAVVPYLRLALERIARFNAEDWNPECWPGDWELLASEVDRRERWREARAALHMELGRAYSLQGQWDLAERELRAASSLNPSTGILYELGKVLVGEQKYAEAVEKLSIAAADEAHKLTEEIQEYLEKLTAEQKSGLSMQELLATGRSKRREIVREMLMVDLRQTPAKDFRLETYSGSVCRLSEQQGKVVLLNFWATWCGPCVQELPFLTKLHEDYRDEGFVVLGINVDPESENLAGLIKKYKINFPVLLDKERAVDSLYGVTGYPTNVVIDRRGNVRYFRFGRGASTEEEIDILVETLLRQAAAGADPSMHQ